MLGDSKRLNEAPLSRSLRPRQATFYDRRGLLREVSAQFRIDVRGCHGISHWARVKYHGAVIGKMCGADLHVIELFAFLHDSQRVDEYTDPDHGGRAADHIRALNGRFFDLDRIQLETLCVAVTHHSDGLLHDNPTIQSCWDADRLDLGRVGIMPNPAYISKNAHPQIERALRMSMDWVDRAAGLIR